jgi:hypothetical protein
MLDKFITGDTLENLVGAAGFQRGEEYFFSDSVGQLCDTGDVLK